MRVFVSCGEVSGDLYAGELLTALRELDPKLEAFGLGGDAMRGAGAEIIVPMDEVSVIGLVEVIGKIPVLRRTQRSLLRSVEAKRPDIAVLIDFSGFNLRLGKRLKAMGIPIVYYVSPQVWAWREGRVQTIREIVTEMLVLLPFEESFYRSRGVPVRHVGHPLVDRVRPDSDRGRFCESVGLDSERPYVLFLPGSRRRELELHGPVLVRTIERLASARPELQFLVSRAPGLPDASFDALANVVSGERAVRFVSGRPHTAMVHADCAIVASGTATLEAALCEVPMVVVYRVGWLSYLLGRPFVRVPHFAMVNLIAEKRLVPELIQRDMNPEAITREIGKILDRPESGREQREGFAEVRESLGGGGGSMRAAQAIVDAVSKRGAG